MDKEHESSILDIIKRNLEINNSNKHFSMLSHEFYELFNSHHRLVENLKMLEKSLTETNLNSTLENIKNSLEVNLKHIMEILSQLTNRSFFIYITTNDDTLWKISKKFNSNIEEICELNNIKNVFKIEESKVLLIPIDNSQF